MQDDLANLFDKRMKIGSLAAPPAMVAQSSEPLSIPYNISQHYHHSSHLAKHLEEKQQQQQPSSDPAGSVLPIEDDTLKSYSNDFLSLSLNQRSSNDPTESGGDPELGYVEEKTDSANDYYYHDLKQTDDNNNDDRFQMGSCLHSYGFTELEHDPEDDDARPPQPGPSQYPDEDLVMEEEEEEEEEDREWKHHHYYYYYVDAEPYMSSGYYETNNNNVQHDETGQWTSTGTATARDVETTSSSFGIGSTYTRLPNEPTTGSPYRISRDPVFF